MISLDGSQGEGGGQVLRSALALSILTGKTLEMFNIRAGRTQPGLRAQHLTAVQAAAKICGGDLKGDRMGSTKLRFEPGPVQPGSYRFDIPTAGSACLVLQTVFLPLSSAAESSSVVITGGTHVSWSPCFHYLDWSWLPILKQLGYDGKLALKRAGFYPPGGGRIQALIRPTSDPVPLTLTSRGKLKKITGLSGAANLPDHIPQRQRLRAARRLKELGPVRIQQTSLTAPSPGTFLCLLAHFEKVQIATFGLGKKGKPAEQVADEAVDELLAFLDTDAAVDRYLTDQLLLPLALASDQSTFSTAQVTEHLQTNSWVIQQFLPVDIKIQAEAGEPGTVLIRPTELAL